jgi:hypothetical protein
MDQVLQHPAGSGAELEKCTPSVECHRRLLAGVEGRRGAAFGLRGLTRY